MGEKHMGYVINNYSSSGQVQIRRFGADDNISDTTKCKWAYVDQGNEHAGVAGTGTAHNLKPGCRVTMSQYGGPEGSYVAGGTVGRMGSGGDGDTSFSGVNGAQTDYCIPCKNAGAPNGERAQAMPPDGRYNPQAGGSPLDLSSSSYPDCQYKDG